MSDSLLINKKRELRKKFRHLRAKRVATDVSPSLEILSKRLQLPSAVLGFFAFRGEPSPQTFLKSLPTSVKIFLPVISDAVGVMNFYRWQPGDPVQQNNFGIHEPVQRLESYQDERALILVPGLVFDRKGYRIGYGGGYYDRFLPLHKQHLIKVGLCYEEELIEDIPHESHDQRMDYIVTNKTLLEVSHEEY